MTLLLLAHAYFRPVLIVVLLCPAAVLMLSRRGLPGEPPVAAAPPVKRDYVERAILAAVAVFLCVYLLDALTSPAGGWDGLVTWGKWTADWGRRSASGDYAVGGYPQLVPRFLSVLYKLDGTSLQVLPLDTFVIHGFGVAAAAWLVLASARLARLLALPSWPLVLLSFGSLTFREQIGSGSVDVLLAAATVTLLALFLALRKGEWNARRGAWTVLGAAMFVCLFTRVTGLFALAAVAGAALSVGGERAHAERRQLLLGVALALAAIAPFVVEQGLAESRSRHAQPRPDELNIPAGDMARVLAADSDQVSHGEPLAMRPKAAVLRFWSDYAAPDVLRWPLSALLVILFAAGAMRRDLRGLAVVVSLYAVVWLAWSSYDQRSLFLALPLVGAIAATGAVRLASRWGRPLILSLLAVVIGAFVVISGAGLLKDAQARLKATFSGPASILLRLAMMPQGPAGRPPFFFPRYTEVYRYVSTLARRTNAQHVFATSLLFRFYENGVFTLFNWPAGLSLAGDVFAGHDGRRPDDSESWVLVAAPGWHRVWLREQLQDMPIPTPGAAGPPGATGDTELMIETGPFDYDNGVVTWQVTTAEVPPASQVVAAFDASDPQSIDTELTTTTVDHEPSQSTTRYAGLIVLKAGIYQPSGSLRVGIRASGPPVQILSFKLSRRRGDGHRPQVE